MTWAPNTVTVASIILGARQRADMQNTQFCSDSEILGYVNISFRKLYNHVVNRFENYYVSEQSIALIPNTQEYDLPTDFFKLLGCDMVRGDRTFTMQPWSFNERNRIINGWVGTPVRYILKGGKILFSPIPTTTDPVIMYYIPAPAALTLGGSVEVFNGFDEYIMIDAAIKMKQKEESDVSVLLADRAEMLQLINETLIGRDAGLPQRMTDIARLNDRAWFQFWGL